ncbi:ABC transporter substrate-binding protein [Rhizobium wenxiniae]|uniref:ABC transporter substrate-binding protein n=1 Tax=Rhizobium wenxiniae TaxID=1737357 RepID=UPI003C1E68B4
MIVNRRDLLKYLAISSAAAALPGQLFAAPAAKTLRVGLSTYPSHFRPWINVGYAGQLVSALINRNLVTYDAKGQLVGELAESWKRENDLTWAFVLKDVKFSNGQPVTSADVKWTLEKIAAEGSGAYMRDPVTQISLIEIVDDRNFKLVTKAPDVTIPSVMAYPFLGIIAAGSTDAQEQGVGAGPFTIVSAEKGVGISLTASEHYFKEGLPSFKDVQITPYADENLRVAALTAGDVDLIDYVPWSAMDTIDKDANLKLDAMASGAFMYLSFNGSGVFKDPKLRQAVAFGIRREEIVNTVFYGRGAPLSGVPRPSVSPYYNKELANYWSYDPAKAKALLKEAGHENGLEVSLLATSQYTMHSGIAVLVQSHLAEIGIKVNLTMPDWATRVTMGNRGVGDFAVQGIGIDTLDPDAAATVIDPSLTQTFLRSRNFEVPGLSDLLQRGRQEGDEAKRIALYAEVDKLVCDNTSFCGLAYRATGFARNKTVGNLELLPDQMSPFSATLFDKLALA